MKNQSNDFQSYNIKIGSLNVCGLKRRLEYPDFTKYFENYDILCFMETMLDDNDIISLPGFSIISQPRKQKHFRKSGGLAVLIKDRFAEFCKHIGTTSDYILWLSLNKNLTNTEENVIIGVIYVPPTQSRFFNDEELTNLENEITSMCSSYKYVFITGDFNARTSHLNDFTHFDHFVSEMFEFDEDTVNFFDKTNYLDRLNIPLQRASKDTKINNARYWMIDICKNNNLFIINGRFGKDKGIGSATFRYKSVIDYTICTAESFDFLHEFEVIELDQLFSDGHTLLSWSLSANVTSSPVLTNKLSEGINFKWSDDANIQFNDSINMQEIHSLNENFLDIDLSATTPSSLSKTINEITDKIADVFMQAASKSLKRKRSPYKRRPFDKPWFGPACKIARKKYHRARNFYNQNKNNHTKNNLNINCKLYNQTMNKYINLYENEKTIKLRAMQTKNPKDYWKYLKKFKY